MHALLGFANHWTPTLSTFVVATYQKRTSGDIEHRGKVSSTDIPRYGGGVIHASNSSESTPVHVDVGFLGFIPVLVKNMSLNV